MMINGENKTGNFDNPIVDNRLDCVAESFL